MGHYHFPFRVSIHNTGYRPVETDRNSPYFVDQYGNILDTAPAEETYVEVLYDSRWDDTTTRFANAQVQQYININGIVLRGSSRGYVTYRYHRVDTLSGTGDWGY